MDLMGLRIAPLKVFKRGDARNLETYQERRTGLKTGHYKRKNADKIVCATYS